MTLSHSPNIVRDGLVLYLDAANPKSYPRTGSTWYDLSGNEKHCSWASAPSYASDEAGGYFSTLGNRCTGPASNTFEIDNNSGYTVINICKINTVTNASTFKFQSSNSGGRGIFSHLVWGDGNLYFDQGGCCSADTRTVAPHGGAQSWNAWAFTKDNYSRKIFKNGVSLTENTATPAAINLSSVGVEVVGADATTTWNAKISCFIVYNRGLSDAELQQNFNALRGRYGI